MIKLLLKDFEKALLFGLIFSVILGLSRFEASCEDMRQNILRIHIIANSDSTADQDVKLKVRDALLCYSEDIFSNCESLEIAENSAKDNLEKFEKIANSVLKNGGFDYRAEAKIGKSFFPTREYDTFTLPAGYYNSLIINLGEAKGHNWWCVIYPSICIGSSNEMLDKSVKPKSAEIARNPKKYIIKFKAVEIYQMIKKRCRAK